MGPSAKLFTLEEKLNYHPELVEERRTLSAKEVDYKNYGMDLINRIVELLLSLEGQFSSASIHNRTRILKSKTEAGFQSAIEIIDTMHRFSDDTNRLLRHGSKHPDAQKTLVEVVTTHNALLKDLISLEDVRLEQKGYQQKHLEEQKGSQQKHIESCFRRIGAIQRCLNPFTMAYDVHLSQAMELQTSIREAEASLKLMQSRVEADLTIKARVLMSTIGSSHKLPKRGVDDGEGDGLVAEELSSAEQEMVARETIAIFDEAGCIPSYELLGLSRINGMIKALVAVGDKHQLPPFNPNQNFSKRTRAPKKGRKKKQVEQKEIKSILDVSKRDYNDDSKVKLCTQYRVPRDIAELLNARVYKGEYITPITCKIPKKGFHLLDVPPEREEKYVNKEEVRKCIQMVEQIIHADEGGSIMLLTPYKKQQREMQFQMKRKGLNEDGSITIFSIDQCQGEEADYVLLSLAQKPTRFLDKHRLNVALSRVRKKLFLFTSRVELQQASKDPSWDCSRLAKDLLKL